VALSGAHTIGRAFKERSGTVDNGYGEEGVRTGLGLGLQSRGRETPLGNVSRSRVGTRLVGRWPKMSGMVRKGCES
jgi:hypothetical protein